MCPYYDDQRCRKTGKKMSGGYDYSVREYKNDYCLDNKNWEKCVESEKYKSAPSD